MSYDYDRGVEGESRRWIGNDREYEDGRKARVRNEHLAKSIAEAKRYARSASSYSDETGWIFGLSTKMMGLSALAAILGNLILAHFQAWSAFWWAGLVLTLCGIPAIITAAVVTVCLALVVGAVVLIIKIISGIIHSSI
jgi:hypothetical protein